MSNSVNIVYYINLGYELFYLNLKNNKSYNFKINLF